MSIPRYRIPPKAVALLHERDVTCAWLAEKSGLATARVIRALSGHPLARPEDRTALIPFVTAEECHALGWNDAGCMLLVEQISQTERPGRNPLPAVDADLEAPEGPGTDGHKPLMRNRRVPRLCTPAMGLLPATLSVNTNQT